MLASTCSGVSPHKAFPKPANAIRSGEAWAQMVQTPLFGNLPEAAKLGAERTWSAGVTNLSFLWNIVIGNVSSCNVSGPIGIAKVSGDAARQGIDSFILLIALLSTSVGLLNLFPIPVLDGGHLVFHAFEAVTGKPPSDRALRVLMGIGLTALLGLMVFALTNDIFCP